jgi:hypothetical protein
MNTEHNGDISPEYSNRHVMDKGSNIIRRLMDNMKLLLICSLRVLLSQSFIFFRFYFFINVYMVLFLFNNVIYVFVLL